MNTPKLGTELTLEQADRIFRFPEKPVKCECVTTSANNPDDNREFADPNCPLCDGDGWQKRETPLTGIACDNCGELDARYDRQEWDVTPTDRGEDRREYTAHYCQECAEELGVIENERQSERIAEERNRHDYFGY